MNMLRKIGANAIAPTLVVSAALAIAAGGPPAEEGAPGSGSADQRIQQLIEQLGHDDYFVREKAQSELAKYSFEAFEALTAATRHEDLEVAARARYLLRLMQVEWTKRDDPPEVRKLLADYEAQNTSNKLARMRALAALPDRQGVSALCRLVRFEKSMVLSKHAAIELLRSLPADQPPQKEFAELLRKHLGASRRTATEWLLTYLRFAEEPDAVITDWTKLVEAEHVLLGRSPTQSSPGIVAELVRFQIEWLKKLKQRGEAVAAIRRLVDLKQGDPETLADLLVWLVEQKATQAVEELATKLASRFAGNPGLLYTVAATLLKDGNPQQAERMATLALNLNAGKTARSLALHYTTARDLQQRGMLQWAQREYRHVIDSGTPDQPVVVLARYIFAELLHDQGDDLDAVKVLEILAKAKEQLPGEVTAAGIKLAAIRARMDYFHACHFQNEGDTKKQRECLSKALEADPTDVDVLIACHRLPDQTPSYRERIRGLIRKSAAEIRQRIADEPKNATPYNQFAWLVGNTEGDLDEALKYSRKSIELSPDSGGYYDTLAHVYFARGDYENAFQTQTKAAELEPHSGLIARQLEVFRKKWEEKKQEQQEQESQEP